MAALSWPGHYQAPWMPVFSSFVGRGIDSHSPGNDCHTSAKSQPPTGANHIKRGCQGALLVNRGNKHLLILTYSSAADTHRCALSHCLHWEKMYCLDLISLFAAPLLSFSASLCQVVLVLTSSLPRHKGLLKCLRMLYGCMTRGGWHCCGSESIQDVNEIHSVFTFNLELSHTWFSLYKVWTSKVDWKEEDNNFQWAVTSALVKSAWVQVACVHYQLQITVMVINLVCSVVPQLMISLCYIAQ